MQQQAAVQAPSNSDNWPDWLEQTAGGLQVDCSQVRPAAMAAWITDMLKRGMRFSGLDYPVLQQVLTGEAPASGTVRLAAGLVPFPPDRQGLYKAVRLLNGGERADYVFEPVYLDENGQLPAELDFDEFCASMWLKGVRMGLQEDVIRQAITRREIGMREIAHMLAPMPAQDATVEEKTPGLQRDDTPSLRADGKVDLSRFANRYPQVEKDSPLLRKLPGVPGKPGYKVTGEMITVAAPADFDLAAMVGEGTRLEKRPDGEYIVATIKGFLDLDTAAGCISVAEKIVNREGVSARTTGDLVLSGENYEELGDVQDHRQVKGHNMTFHGNVFGGVVSEGGTIHLLQNLAGGKALNRGGQIRVDGRVTSSVVQGIGTDVRLGFAEGSTIVGRHVVIERAVLCQIVAETLEIASAEGCAMLGREIKLGTAASRMGQETIVSVWTPERGSLERDLAEIEARQERLSKETTVFTEQYEQLRQRPEIANFLALQSKLAKQEIRMDAAQTAQWDKLTVRLAPLVKQLAALGSKIKSLQQEATGLAEQRQARLETWRILCGQSRCTVDAIGGELLVQRRPYYPEQPLLQEARLEELLAESRQSSGRELQLFSGEEGSFAWQFASGEEA